MADFAHPAPDRPAIGFPLFDGPVDMDALAAALEDELPGSVGVRPDAGDELGMPDTPLLTVQAQGVTIVLAEMAAPVPDNEALHACHPVWWPDTTAVAQHTHHLIMAAHRDPEQPADREDALVEALAFSLVATIALEQPGAVGLYYGNASTTFPSGPYRTLVIDCLEQNRPPVAAWVSTWLSPGAEGLMNGYTVGLASLGHAELVVEDSARQPSDVYHMLTAITEHLVSTGSSLSPGASVGPDENTRHAVTARPMGVDGFALQIDF